MSLSKLKQRCREFGLPVSGAKDDLIYRLENLKQSSGLAKKTIYQLKTECNERGLAVSGNKDDLIRRLRSSSSSSSSRVKATPQKRKRASKSDNSFHLERSVHEKKNTKKRKVVAKSVQRSVKQELYTVMNHGSSSEEDPYYSTKQESYNASYDYGYGSTSRSPAYKKKDTRSWLQLGRASVLNIGKHRGKTYMDIYNTSPGYCDWVRRVDNPSGELRDFRDWLERE